MIHFNTFGGCSTCLCVRVCVCVCVCVSFVFTDRHQNIVTNSNMLTCLVQHMSNMLARQLTQPSAHLPLKGLSPQQQSQVLSQYNHDQQRAPAPMQPMVHRLPTFLHTSFLCLCSCCCCWNGWLAVPTVCCLRTRMWQSACMPVYAACMAASTCCLLLAPECSNVIYAYVPCVLHMPITAGASFAWCHPLFDESDQNPTDQMMRSGPWPWFFQPYSLDCIPM